MAKPPLSDDPTVKVIPLFFATMAGEHLLSRRRIRAGSTSAGDYERRDTVASVTMGTLSLVGPLVLPRVLRHFTPGRGRYGRTVVVGALGAAAATTVADAVGRRRDRPGGVAARVSQVGGVASVVLGGVAASTAWQWRTSLERLWKHRLIGKSGRRSLPAALAAIAGWDFIYYWNHRLMHECRWMWAVHVVHHSSERYNLSTALRQPVLEAVSTPIPYGILCLFGVRPGQVEIARGVNLLYQYWIHTELIGRLAPPAESVLNTPSHHRVHHGSNSRYIDRNHGSILILWDRLFGTFAEEKEQVVYGLTKNIRSFNIATIATHEFSSILRDVAASTTWRDRLSYLVRGPGWADQRRRSMMREASLLKSVTNGQSSPASGA